MSAIGGGLNRSTQHFILERKDGVWRQIKDLVSIRMRLAAVEDRAVHWEGDLLSGSKNSYIATLVERHPNQEAVTIAALTDAASRSCLLKRTEHAGHHRDSRTGVPVVNSIVLAVD
jgi:IS30 family transposase